jgi:hypothetical protein
MNLKLIPVKPTAVRCNLITVQRDDIFELVPEVTVRYPSSPTAAGLYKSRSFLGISKEEMATALGLEIVDYISLEYGHSTLSEQDFEALKNVMLQLSYKIKPAVVCLCGSTRFYKTFMLANYQETMKGNIVLSVGFYPHAASEMHGEGVGITEDQKKALDDLHKRKIDMADEILVLDVPKDGVPYIGSSTKSEIEHATAKKKSIRYWSQENPAYVEEQSKAA